MKQRAWIPYFWQAFQFILSCRPFLKKQFWQIIQGNGQPDWIFCSRPEDLPFDESLDRLVSDEQFYGRPRISPDFAGRLESPLSAFHTLTAPILTEILFFTNLRLKSRGISEISMGELVDYYMYQMAAAVFQQSSHVMTKIGRIRRDMKNVLKVKASWPCQDRLLQTHMNLCMYDSQVQDSKSGTRIVWISQSHQ